MGILGGLIAFFKCLLVIFILKMLDKNKRVRLWVEKTNGFLFVIIFFVVTSLVFTIPFGSILRLNFNTLDKSTSYHLWGSGLKEKIKINNKNYVVVHNGSWSRVDFSLYQENQGLWEPDDIGRSTFYKDLEIYYKKISDDDLLIFAYYISTDKEENLRYQIKDYLGNDFKIKIYDKLIPTVNRAENLICFYTTVKVNSEAYNIIVNNKKVSLR